MDTNAEFYRKPTGRIELDDEVQPFGPSAPLKKAVLGNFRLDDRIEKAYHDTDLMARDAVLELYKNDTLVTRIQRAFSMGTFGARRRPGGSCLRGKASRPWTASSARR